MIAILGGGLAGLQLARRLGERGEDCVVLEKAARPGGLCRTVSSGPYSWDIGPHAFYSKRPEALAHYRALPVRYRELARDVRVCHRGADGRVHEVGYPFENGLADLPLRERLECAAGYCRAALARRGAAGYAHLEDWIHRGLGPGIARHFMLPYNRKIWDCELARVSMDLVQGKIDPEPAWRVLSHSLVPGSVGRAYQARFLYPEQGGAGALTDAVARHVGGRLRASFAVKRVERRGAGLRVVSESGEAVEADAVVSTIPVPELLDALALPELDSLRGSFIANDTWLVAVGLKEGARPGRFASCQWVFFAGPESFYRVTLMHNFSAERPPLFLAEVTAKRSGPALRPDELVERVLADLRADGLIRAEGDVALAEAMLERYTYPIPTVGLGAARAELEARLARLGITLLGRSGRWDYMNTDGVFLKVEELLERRGRAAP